MAKDNTTGGNAVWETIKTIVYALLIAGVFRTLFFQPFWIPSGSMKDTLLIGDFLFVNKMAYGYSYASCPSIYIPRFGIDIQADDLCGFLDGDNSRLMGSEPERGDVVTDRKRAGSVRPAAKLLKDLEASAACRRSGSGSCGTGSTPAGRTGC